MQTPVHTIASNAGVEGAVVVGKLLEQGNTDLGYDAAKGMLSKHFPSICLKQLVKVIRTLAALVSAEGGYMPTCVC